MTDIPCVIVGSKTDLHRRFVSFPMADVAGIPMVLMVVLPVDRWDLPRVNNWHRRIMPHGLKRAPKIISTLVSICLYHRPYLPFSQSSWESQSLWTMSCRNREANLHQSTRADEEQMCDHVTLLRTLPQWSFICVVSNTFDYNLLLSGWTYIYVDRSHTYYNPVLIELQGLSDTYPLVLHAYHRTNGCDFWICTSQNEHRA